MSTRRRPIPVVQQRPAIPLVEAACYARMSTERQCYSIANQELAIADYAKRNNLIIVQHYVDRAKSGLSVKGRTGLKTLLRDVVTGHAGYKVILVYDISRWGRFQDTDEAGHYEFLCREAGVQVRYCAEPFETDEAVAASLFKAVKRTMAAEFSRTLSTNVYAAKTYVAGKGYWVGGSPPYGWQRIAIVGDQRYFLGKGQRIAGSRGRVVLAHGDEEEIRDVRTIFRLAGRGLRDSEVATQLSYAGRTFRGSLWSRRKVGSILVHPVYMGCNVWGRTNQELKGPTTQVPSEKWTIMRGAFRPIISERLFEKVQKLRERRKALRRVPSNEEILQKARQFLGAKGWFTTASLASANMPSSEFYKYHFGSFRKVQSLIGYQSRRLEVMQRTRWLRLKFIRFLLARFSKRLVHRFQIQEDSSGAPIGWESDNRCFLLQQLAVATRKEPVGIQGGWVETRRLCSPGLQAEAFCQGLL